MREYVLTFNINLYNAFHNDIFIGDSLYLTHKDGAYVITDGEGCVYGTQDCSLHHNNDDVDNLIDYTAKKRGSRFVVWDDPKYMDELDGIMVEVIAVTKDYCIVLPSTIIQDALEWKATHEIDEILKSFEDLTCEKSKEVEDRSFHCPAGETGTACDFGNEEKRVEEETSMFSELGSSFGKINSNQFRLSINGLAVRGKDGKYLTFNPETRELVEVTTGFFDDMKDLLFVMPATELEVGDIILHQNKPYYITSARDNQIKGIDFEDAVESVLVPKTNVFGIKYYTKVFNCLGTNNILGTDIASNPMLAYALMGGKDFDLGKVMMFQALSGQGKGIADFSENPIMLMALMSNEKGGGDLSDFAKMQILSQISGNKKAGSRKEKETKEN